MSEAMSEIMFIVTKCSLGAIELTVAGVLLYAALVVCINQLASWNVTFNLEGEGKSIAPRLTIAQLIATIILVSAGIAMFNVACNTTWAMTGIICIYLIVPVYLLFHERISARWEGACMSAVERIVWYE